jgi:type I restriction enzyme, S subunit
VTVVLKDLLLDSKDGEWGKGEATSDSVAMLAIRGTDFEDVRIGQLQGVPLRHIPARIAARKTLRPLDIVFETAGGSKDRPTGRSVLLRPAHFQRAEHPITCASFARFLRIDPMKADPEYVFWMLQHLYNSDVLRAYHTQHTGVARYQYTTFAENEPLTLPDRGAQRRIASILSAYDELIENNTRRIAILEEMARCIYEEWFVRFRFPGHEGVRMVESKWGLLPEGWRAAALGDVAAYINRGLAPKYDDTAACIVINQKCIRDQRLNLGEARKQGKPVPAEKVVRLGDVLINSTGVGTLGRVAQVLEAVDNCTVDTHVSIVRPGKDSDPDYFGLALLSQQAYFEAQGVGSTGQTELSRSRIAETSVVVPPLAVQQAFAKLVRPMRRLTVTLHNKNLNLRTTRDLLLPKLISGELDVSVMPTPEALAA